MIFATSCAGAEPSARELLANHRDGDVFVYQAFNVDLAAAAVCAQNLDVRGFGLDRMSWIKPSLGWMIHRSHFARATNQERVLRVRVSEAAFRDWLGRAVPTAHDARAFETRGAWRNAMKASDVLYQWDPARDLDGRRLAGRAILQLGLKDEALAAYAARAILEIEDITDLIRRAEHDAAARDELRARFPELPFAVDAATARRLGRSDAQL